MENLEIIKENLSISEAVLSIAKEKPSSTALSYMGVKISYMKFMRRIQELSISFYSLGVQKGDVVLVFLPNIPQVVYTLYALNRIGAVAAFASPLSVEAEVENYINKTKANIAVVLDSLYEKTKSVFAKAGVEKVVTTSIFDELKFIDIPKKSNVICWRTMIRSHSKGSIYISPQKSSDTAIILFSGGTTGSPKAVELTNLNLNALAEGTKQMCGCNVSGVKMLSVLPVFHGFGLGICIHTVLYFGGECILVPRFNAEKTGRIIKREKPDYMTVVPSMLEPIMSAKSLTNADLSRFLGVFCGGDTLTSQLEEKFNDFLYKHNSAVRIRQGYGLTECVSSSCLMPENKFKHGSIGKPYPHTQYIIVKENTCEELSTGEVGEICISGKTVMKGYFDDDAETRNTLKNHSDGKLWLHTGDLGFVDEEGFVFFVGRIKRVIISNGYNIFPIQIEEVLLKHKDIKECCVVGVRDIEKSEIAVVIAVLNLKFFVEKIKENEILTYLSKHISKPLMPKHVYFIGEIPKTSLGKFAYSELNRIAENKTKTTAE